MKGSVQSLGTKIQKFIAKRRPVVPSDQDRLRESARVTLRKYHKTFRKLAQE